MNCRSLLATAAEELKTLLPMPAALFTTIAHDGVAPFPNLLAALQPQTWQQAALHLAAVKPNCPCPASPLDLWEQLHTACTAISDAGSNAHSSLSHDTLELLGIRHSIFVMLVNIAASLGFSIDQRGVASTHFSLLQTVAGLKLLDSSDANISIWPHVTSSSTQQHATNHQQSSPSSVVQIHSLLQEASQQVANSVDNQPALAVNCCLQVELALVAAWSLMADHSSSPVQTLGSDPSSAAQQQAAQQDESRPAGMSDDTMLQSLAQLLKPLTSLLRDLIAATNNAVRCAVQQRPILTEMPDKALEVLEILRLDLDASKVSA